jgi:uncharacterized Ntn-hydrolase superfamily protein
MIKFLIILLFLFTITLQAQMFSGNPLVHTYSIVAVDSITGQIGAAVQSHWFSVGSMVTWAEAGVGAIATQSFVNPAFGPEGLKLLKAGKSPTDALNMLLAQDEGKQFRQVALIDARGNSVAHTGQKCIPEAGHTSGKYYSMQANLMNKNTVWAAMEHAFLNTQASLAERMVAALEAAEKEGGDIRGKQSAALLVVAGSSSGEIWKDRQIDLDVAVEKGDEQAALKEYSAAEKLQPDNLEMQYWHAISLLNLGRYEAAYKILVIVFAKDPNWRELTPRLIKPGILKVDENIIEKIMNL